MFRGKYNVRNAKKECDKTSKQAHSTIYNENIFLEIRIYSAMMKYRVEIFFLRISLYFILIAVKECTARYFVT